MAGGIHRVHALPGVRLARDVSDVRPYEAISFDTEERAKKWMKGKGTVPYPPPWTPVQHGFED